MGIRVNINENTTIIINKFKELVRDESGATAIEYGLLSALVGVMMIAGAKATGDSLNEVFNRLNNGLSTPSVPSRLNRP